MLIIKKKVKFIGIENLYSDDADMVDYSLVTVQTGNPLSKFIGMDGEYGIYEINDLEGFEKELENIKEKFNIKVITK